MVARVLVSIALIALLLVGAGGLVAWLIVTMAEPEQTVRPRPLPAVLAPPLRARKDYRVRIVGYGSARPRVRLRIAPQVAGEVVAKAEAFLSGRHVRKGQMLFEIDKTDYVQARDAAQRQIDLVNVQLRRLDVEQANLQASEKIDRERVKLAGDQLAKARQLLSRGAASRNDVDAAEQLLLQHKTQLQGILNQVALVGPQREQLAAEVALAKVKLAQAETSIARTRVASPVTGRVLECSVEVGEHVAVGRACGELYGTDIMDVAVSVPAGEVKWLGESLAPASAPAGDEARRPAEVPAVVTWQQPDGGGRVVWRGRVGRIEAGLAAQTRTATIVVEVTNPLAGAGPARLDLNMFCKVVISGRRVPVAYLLPRTAVLSDGSVYVVNSGRLARRVIRPARLTGDEVMLLPGGGVEAGDRVIRGYVPKPVLDMRVRAVDRLDQANPGNRPSSAPAKAKPAKAGAPGPARPAERR